MLHHEELEKKVSVTEVILSKLIFFDPQSRPANALCFQEVCLYFTFTPMQHFADEAT